MLVQCAHPAVAASRLTFVNRLPQRLEQLVLLALLPRQVYQRLAYLGQTQEIARRQQVAEDVRALASLTDWQSSDGRFSLFRLFAVATWPLQMVERDDLHLSRVLAMVFSACEMKNHHLRPLANAWAGWAGPGVTEIFACWNSAAAFPPLPALLFVADPSVPVAGRALRRSGRTRLPSLRQREALTAHGAPEPSYIEFDDGSDSSSVC